MITEKLVRGERMKTQTQYKKDKTRLINLLEKYRNHIITTRATKFKHIQSYEIVNKIDRAINNIINNI